MPHRAREPGPDGQMAAPRRLRAITPTLLAAVAATAGFALLAWHRRWMCDDGLIVVRTVRELLAGNGPVYNAFERAEPDTSTLWTYALALVGWLTGGSLSLVAVALGGLFAVAGLAIAIDAARRWQRARGAAGWLAPAGALVVIGASPFWDFATSGLETGLGQLWLAASWWLLVWLRVAHGDRGAGPEPSAAARSMIAAAAAVFGLGPLVRPDFAIASAAFLIAGGWVLRPGWRRTLRLVAAAAALPVAYEVFRAGYYGALVPLPALAKGAAAARWDRGLDYLWNFVRPYALWLPFGAIAAACGASLARRARIGRDCSRIGRDRAVAAAPIAAALGMAVYVTRVGGDFMHARMLLPAAFAALLPAMVLPVTRRTAAALLALAGWALVVGIRRDHRASPGIEVIQDGWAGYRLWTHHDHPIDPAVFVAADGAASRAIEDALRAGHRRLLTEANDLDAPMDPALPGPAVYAAGRLGTCGAVMPLDGIVADTLGLASPLGARITVVAPDAMAGHEKPLPRAWLLALYADPAFDSTAIPDGHPGLVAAARRALGCGELAELLASTRAPLSARRFWDNLVGAWRRTRLVVPAQPFDAEAKFCGGPVKVRASSSYELEGWSIAAAIDGNRAPTVPGWSSGFSVDPRPEWIEIGVPAGRVSRVTLYPMTGHLFPIDFAVQIWNGAAWVDRVVETGFAAPDAPVVRSWSPADTTERIRIYATRLPKIRDLHVMQFAEIETAP